MFQFDFPWFALLLPLPFFVKTWLTRKRAQEEPNTPALYFPSLNRLEQAFGQRQYSKNKEKPSFFWMLWLVWALLIVALMRPEKVDQFTQVKNIGYDLMLAVDVSGSMQALDFSTLSKQISRLDVTKEVVGQFVQERQGDRIGLITFGEHAYMLVPLTLDTRSVSKMLQDTVSGMAGNATAIGDAIGLSVRTLRERPEGSRVMILLTDGADNSSKIPPLESAKLAKQYGIRIYTIGIGREGPVPFPNQFGGVGLVETPMDEELLQQIATLTDGQFFKATDKQALKTIYGKIDALEKSESDDRIYLIREPLFAYPLALAMILLFILTLFELLAKRKVSYGT